MRITLVSAHYPPNFVSGGTLQPQRLARGLAERGHEVRVFAGHLDSTRKPLETWEEADPSGLIVRWVVSTPWMDWADERNYDNPPVTAVFEEELATNPADVVHIHALQTLGVGLVEAASRSGAVTVVTMHDFWWACARQFLVDRDHRPCSLVVAAGDCACEDGRAHLDRRRHRLAAALDAADLILAPSHSAAEVLRANGIDGTRLEVDENGIDLPQVQVPRRSERQHDGPVVVRYTGGSNPMKGADVLVEVAHSLGPDQRLRILAHDLEEAVERDGRSLENTMLELLPPYRPDELDEVLAVTDILVLPSIMRESHSLVTREALLRGVPVVATDTIGPEEVVEDGVNGLIVPAGDAALLRLALLDLTDRSVLDRLRNGASKPPPVRTVAEQLDGLEGRYSDLIQARSRSGRRDRPAHRVLFIVGIDGAPLRYRAYLPAEALALHGVPSDIRHYRDPDVGDLAQQADVLVAYRVPATRQVLKLLQQHRERGGVAIFDVDDLIFDPDIADEIPALRLLPPDEADLWMEGVRRYRTTMEACDAFVGSTLSLVSHAREKVGIDSYLFENGVGCALGAASDIARLSRRRPDGLRVGYFSGTTTHDDDWRFVEDAVVEVLERHPDAELWLGGHLNLSGTSRDRLRGRLRRLPFMSWTDLPSVLRQVDVNLAPLEPGSRFNEAKSAIKWLEAALVETPTIASPSGPFESAIEHGRTGWLAADKDEWASNLDIALTSSEQRALVGARARRAALLRWSPHLQGERYLEMIDQVIAASAVARRSPSPAWTPVALDEPPAPARIHLEPYPPKLAGSRRLSRRHRRINPIAVLRFKLARVRETWADAGVSGTLRGVARVALRVAGRLVRAPSRLWCRLRSR